MIIESLNFYNKNNSNIYFFCCRWKGDKVDATDESNLKSPPERKLR